MSYLQYVSSGDEGPNFRRERRKEADRDTTHGRPSKRFPCRTLGETAKVTQRRRDRWRSSPAIEIP